MYPRIYKRNEIDFNHNGYGVLKDLIKCEVIEEDNGMFELEGECTISSFLFEHIQEENIIKALYINKIFWQIKDAWENNELRKYNT